MLWKKKLLQELEENKNKNEKSRVYYGKHW
jgi:hypothetical protein